MNREQLHKIGNNLLVDIASIVLAFASTISVVNAVNILYSAQYKTGTLPPDNVSSATYNLAYAIGFALTIVVARKYRRSAPMCPADTRKKENEVVATTSKNTPPQS